MTVLEEIELHDALLKSMNIDYTAKAVTVGVEFYKDSAKARERTQALLIFEGVESVSQISNFDRLQENAFAGNVNYWAPDEKGGVTYVYLVDGCIAIKAQKVRLENKAQ